MFNAPRPTPPQYSTSNGFGSSPSSTRSFNNPLSASIYSDGGYADADPWGSLSVSTPALATPQSHTQSLGGGGGGSLGNVLGTASIPPIYREAFEAADPHSGEEISLNALIRVLGTSQLPAYTTDKIVNMVSSRPRVSRPEFYIALALVGLAQQGHEISIEHVAQRASDDSLPEPTLALSSLPDPHSMVSTTSPAVPSSPTPAYTQGDSDPWSSADALSIPPAASASSTVPVPGAAGHTNGSGAPVALTGELGKEWWKRQARVEVSIVPEKKGFILARYTAYLVTSDRGPQVTRRYSEFAYLFDCLVRRYPFRILPSLPPKHFGGDSGFLEGRRKGLQRFLNFIINHPVIKEDGLLTVFLTEPSLEAWRKHASISLDEESSLKRVDAVEEMSIPRDFEERAKIVRDRMPVLIDQWTRISTIAERILKRSEASASDLSRLTMTLNAAVDENRQSWRADDDEFHFGVQQGLMTTSRRLTALADSTERRVRISLLTSLEAIKAQRDLYIATRDLFLRQDRLSGDQVDKLRKRVETNSQKLETITRNRKEGWEVEADKMVASIEQDQNAIANALARRVFIRYSIWHELRVVLYNRENTLLTQAFQEFAREEREFAKLVLANWSALNEELQTMPLE